MGTEKFKPYMEFTAQGMSFQALMLMISQLEKREHSLGELLPVVVFMAFTLEAYLNSLGSRHIEFWDQIERIPWRKKVEVLHIHAGKELDWGSKHLQYASQLFALRDKLAHGKAEVMEGPTCVSLEEAQDKLAGEMLNPPWLNAVASGWLGTARGRFRALMTHFSDLYGLAPTDQQLHSRQWIEVIRSDER